MGLLVAHSFVLGLLLFCRFPGPTEGKVKVPFKYFLLQQPPFEVVTERIMGVDGKNISKDVPLVMRLLFKESEGVTHNHLVPEGGDFLSLARSIRPKNWQEEGLHKVMLDFPTLPPADLKPGMEGWLVFQLRKSYILDNNCTQVLSVFVKDKSSLRLVTSVPLTYKTGTPLLVVNVTSSMKLWGRKNSPSYVATIRDSTKYTTDRSLRSFSNYIDCTLARACEVLELHDPDTTPVLLVLSSELAIHAARGLMDSRTRQRRHAPADHDKSADSSTLSPPVGRSLMMKSAIRQRRAMPKDYSITTESSDLRSSSMYKGDEYCHLKEWSVDVERLGWEWFIFPERIPLNLCVGRCPDLLGYHFNATSHAVAKGLYRMIMGHDTKPENIEPCCVPVKYRRFSMLIEKRPGVISLETSADLLAIKCGCR